MEFPLLNQSRSVVKLALQVLDQATRAGVQRQAAVRNGGPGTMQEPLMEMPTKLDRAQPGELPRFRIALGID
jgi:hypothetical protein